MDNLIIYNTDDGKTSVKLYANDGTVWMTQAQMAELFDKERSGITKHIKNIFQEGELEESGNVRFLHIPNVAKRTAFYSLDMILAVGFRVHSPRGKQFRRWANTTLKEYLQKGFVLDDERLKNPDGRPDYFDELLARIRDIRASEKRFYQKLRDLFALSVDYDKTDKETHRFFAHVQNMLIFGVTGMTAADLILDRADADAPNMALTSWQGARVRPTDIYIAKNYLTHDELDTLNRLVNLFLESAELRAKMQKTLTLRYWEETTDQLLASHGIPLLQGHGRHSHAEMKQRVEDVYVAFDERRKQADRQAADRDDERELEAAIKELEEKK